MKKWTVRDLEYFDKPLHCYAKDFGDFLAKNLHELFNNKEDCDNYIIQNGLNNLASQFVEIVEQPITYTISCGIKVPMAVRSYILTPII